MSSRRIAVLAAVLGAALACGPAAAAKSLSQRQIAAAVRRAQRSRDLWATVNICNTRRHRRTIGIRGQMPALGFPAELRMDVQVDYWDSSRHRFVHDPGVHQALALGSPAYGREQGGVAYRFAPTVLLSGTITFEWRRSHRVIGRAVRHTRAHVRHVDGGDPAGYSAAYCLIR